MKYLTLTIFTIFFIGLLTLKQVSAASFEMFPTPKAFICGQQTYTVDIFIDSPTFPTNSADIEIRYNPSIIDIIDSNLTESGTQIEIGNAFNQFWGNRVNETTGVILLAGGSLPNKNVTLTGRALFGRIKFAPTNYFANATFQFDIRFDSLGATLDSNIAYAVDGFDLMTSEIDGNYTFEYSDIPECNSITPPVESPNPSGGGRSGGGLKFEDPAPDTSPKKDPDMVPIPPVIDLPNPAPGKINQIVSVPEVIYTVPPKDTSVNTPLEQTFKKSIYGVYGRIPIELILFSKLLLYLSLVGIFLFWFLQLPKIYKVKKVNTK